MFFARRLRMPCLFCQRACHIRKAQRFIANQLAITLRQSNASLQPRGCRVRQQRRFRGVHIHRRGDRRFQGVGLGSAGKFRLQRFTNDGFGLERLAEKLLGDLRHLLLLLRNCADRNHRRGRADANDWMFRTRTDPANEQSHVRTLTTAIGVQFVENQETDLVVNCLAQSSLPATSQQQLQHHVICEENVRRLCLQFVTAGFVLLPREFRKADGKFLATTRDADNSRRNAEVPPPANSPARSTDKRSLPSLRSAWGFQT